jgi:hypothetical protein
MKLSKKLRSNRGIAEVVAMGLLIMLVVAAVILARPYMNNFINSTFTKAQNAVNSVT